jgi:hypothetical protein
MSRRSRSLNLREPQEPLQACSGKPLPFTSVPCHCRLRKGHDSSGPVTTHSLGLRVRIPPGHGCLCSVCTLKRKEKTKTIKTKKQIRKKREREHLKEFRKKFGNGQHIFSYPKRLDRLPGSLSFLFSTYRSSFPGIRR